MRASGTLFDLRDSEECLKCLSDPLEFIRRLQLRSSTWGCAIRVANSSLGPGLCYACCQFTV